MFGPLLCNILANTSMWSRRRQFWGAISGDLRICGLTALSRVTVHRRVLISVRWHPLFFLNGQPRLPLTRTPRAWLHSHSPPRPYIHKAYVAHHALLCKHSAADKTTIMGAEDKKSDGGNLSLVLYFAFWYLGNSFYSTPTRIARGHPWLARSRDKPTGVLPILFPIQLSQTSRTKRP